LTVEKVQAACRMSNRRGRMMVVPGVLGAPRLLVFAGEIYSKLARERVWKLLGRSLRGFNEFWFSL